MSTTVTIHLDQPEPRTEETVPYAGSEDPPRPFTVEDVRIYLRLNVGTITVSGHAIRKYGKPGTSTRFRTYTFPGSRPTHRAYHEPPGWLLNLIPRWAYDVSAALQEQGQ